MILLIANTAFPYFYRPIESVIIGFCIMISMLFYRGIKIKFTKKSVPFIVLFTIVYIFKVTAGSISILVFAGAFLRLLYAIAVIHILKELFIDYFIVAMKYVCISSFIFYFPYLMSPSSFDSLYTNLAKLTSNYFPFSQDDVYYSVHNFLFYEFSSMHNFRNAGPFWEAGVLGGFSLIALYFQLLREGKLFNSTGIVFIVAIVTTLSTTAYAALALILVFYLVVLKRNFKSLFLFIPILITIFYISFTELYFLQEKIESHSIEVKGNGKITDSTRKTRFVSFLLDFNDALESPWVGVYMPDKFGGQKITKGSKKYFQRHRNSGIGKLFKSYGFIFAILYFYLFYISLLKNTYARKNRFFIASFGCILLLVLSFSESYFSLTFFWCLPFLFQYTSSTHIINTKKQNVLFTTLL